MYYWHDRTTPARWQQVTFSIALGILLAACQCAPRAEKMIVGEDIGKDLGESAVLSIYLNTAVQQRIKDGKVDEAYRLIDGDYSRLLIFLQASDKEIEKQETFRKLRDKAISTLQARWLEDPPIYLDELSAEYLERTCAKIVNCPPGRVHPLRTAVGPPNP